MVGLPATTKSISQLSTKSDDAGDTEPEVTVTDLLIIGTGPAGASLACFLASYGLTGIMLGAASGSADTPRAHITNMAALECLRDIGLEQECVDAAAKGHNMQHTRWCRTMAGEEFARIYSWGNDPQRAGDYDAASPCNHVDLPQTRLEPILVRHATINGFTCRFDTTFLSFERLSDGSVMSKVKDNLTNSIYKIKSKYLFGCDGARSQVLRQLQIPMIKKPGQGLAINILVKIDLSHLVEHRMGNLHWLMQPGEDCPAWGWSAIARMVKPWNEWMFILIPSPSAGVAFEISDADYVKRVRELVGDDLVPLEILNVSKWFINEIVAEHYSEGNIFCLGDAVHRHPPFNGLGSNTCIQDAFNLAWKIAYVMKGHAGPSLLDSYSAERQPVGHGVVTRANQGLRDHVPIWEALGMMETSVSASAKAYAELSETSVQGAARRQKLRAGVEGTAHEFHAVGQEMNQQYESAAVDITDEGPRPPLPADPVLHYQMTTYPGSRLPHAWLNTRWPGPKVSTIDLAGHGAFCLLTGIGGEKWKAAAADIGKKLGVKMNVYSIGWMQDYEDLYFDWARRREVDENACVLIRPDRFVAWRTKGMVEDCEMTLERVMRKVLAL